MAVQTTEELIRKKCAPCEGGIAALERGEAEAQLKKLSGWKLAQGGKAIRKDWVVKNYMAGIHFFEDVARLAEDEGHHPDLHLEGYRNVGVALSTHAIGGLSENDFILAAKIDKVPIKLKTAK